LDLIVEGPGVATQRMRWFTGVVDTEIRPRLAEYWFDSTKEVLILQPDFVIMV
jgi:hypothetical protein